MKARSRLQSGKEKTKDQPPVKTRSSASLGEKKIKETSSLPRRYLTHIPVLVLGLLSLVGVYIVVTILSPAQADILKNQSYLLLLLPTFFTVFFLSSYLTLRSQLGFVLALSSTTLLFFKLKQIGLNLELFLFSFGVYFLGWGVLKFVWKITKSKENKYF